jgi:hypothetical protein
MVMQTTGHGTIAPATGAGAALEPRRFLEYIGVVLSSVARARYRLDVHFPAPGFGIFLHIQGPAALQQRPLAVLTSSRSCRALEHWALVDATARPR